MNAHGQYIAFRAILTKEVLRFTRIWVQTILPPMITTALYFLIFGRLIGSQIGDVHGYHYMQYIVPGLILMAVLTNSYANVVSSFFSAKFQRNIEEMLVAPVPNYLIMLGFIGVELWDAYYYSSPAGQQFMTRWRAQTPLHAVASSAAAMVMPMILIFMIRIPLRWTVRSARAPAPAISRIRAERTSAPLGRTNDTR